MGFYNMAYSICFMPAIALHLSAQVSYYLFMNRFMYRSSVRLFSAPRILLFHLIMHYAHEGIFIERYFQHKYRVNLNELFD